MQNEPWNLSVAAALVRRQWRLVAGAVLVSVGATSGALSLIPPSYQATTWLYFEPAPRNLLDPSARTGLSSDTARIESEIEMIGSQRTMVAAARELGLAAGMSGASDIEREQQAVAWLSDRISVQRRGLSYLIAIRARAAQPDEAAHLANGVANAYQRQQIGRKIDEVVAEQGLIGVQLAKTGNALTQARLALRNSPEDTDLRSHAAAMQASHDRLLARSAAIEAEGYLQMPASRVVMAASSAAPPANPSLPLLYAIATGFGLAAGLIAALFSERLAVGFSDPERAAEALRLNAVQAVPRQKPRRGPDGDQWLSPADTIPLAPLSDFSEAVRRLRASIDRRGPNRGQGSVIMVTSAMAGEGKTTLALALARSYALAGHSCLLIDCDLRNPSLHKHLGIEASEGLLDYLHHPSDVRQLQAMLAADASCGAHIALGGTGARDATDPLIDSPAFSRLIAAARQNYSVVILDTPPVGTVVDSLYLASHADVIAFVMRYRAVPRAEAAHALAALQGTGGRQRETIGVLNMQPEQRLPARYRTPQAYLHA